MYAVGKLILGGFKIGFANRVGVAVKNKEEAHTVFRTHARHLDIQNVILGGMLAFTCDVQASQKSLRFVDSWQDFLT